MKVTLYARVSSERQAEKDLSIPAQLKALRKYALDRDWEVVGEFIDEAESARTANRPAFIDMIAAARGRQKPFDGILVSTASWYGSCPASPATVKTRSCTSPCCASMASA